MTVVLEPDFPASPDGPGDPGDPGGPLGPGDPGGPDGPGTGTTAGDDGPGVTIVSFLSQALSPSAAITAPINIEYFIVRSYIVGKV